MNLIVNLIGGQTTPNIQFIKEFYQDDNELLLITTEDMEKSGQSRWLLNAAQIKEERVKKLLVPPYNLKLMRQELAKLDYDKYDKIVVNITGGTKIMSLTTFDFFKNKGADIYYLTGRSGQYYKIFPERKSNEYTLKNHITLDEYLKANGFKMKKTTPSGIPFDYTNWFFKWFIEERNSEHHKVIAELQEPKQKYRDKGCKIKNVEGLTGLLAEINFPYEGEKLSKYQVKYLTGEWFEEYIYYIVEKRLNIGSDLLQTGVQLVKNQVENEYDVIFLYNERLHLIECKTYILSDRKKGLVNETIYKSASLIKQMGIFAQSYIFTLNKEEDLKKASLDRAKELKIKMVGLENLKTEDLIIQSLDIKRNK